jgi:hypothetical protein
LVYIIISVVGGTFLSLASFSSVEYELISCRKDGTWFLKTSNFIAKLVEYCLIKTLIYIIMFIWDVSSTVDTNYTLSHSLPGKAEAIHEGIR